MSPNNKTSRPHGNVSFSKHEEFRKTYVNQDAQASAGRRRYLNNYRPIDVTPFSTIPVNSLTCHSLSLVCRSQLNLFFNRKGKQNEQSFIRHFMLLLQTSWSHYGPRPSGFSIYRCDQSIQIEKQSHEGSHNRRGSRLENVLK